MIYIAEKNSCVQDYNLSRMIKILVFISKFAHEKD